MYFGAHVAIRANQPAPIMAGTGETVTCAEPEARTSFMIVSGGVTIFPRECEDLLITCPKVTDAAVFGIPNADLGAAAKAAIQLMPGIHPGLDTEAELIAFRAEHLARFEVPRSIDFEDELPRLPTAKPYKRINRDRYLGNRIQQLV